MWQFVEITRKKLYLYLAGEEFETKDTNSQNNTQICVFCTKFLVNGGEYDILVMTTHNYHHLSPTEYIKKLFFLLFAGSRGVVLLTYFATYCNKVFLSIQTFSYYQRIQMPNPIYWNRVLCLILFKFRTIFSANLSVKCDSL